MVSAGKFILLSGKFIFVQTVMLLIVPYIRPRKSHTFDLARNERGLIGDRHVIHKHAASKRCGDLFVGAFKICEAVLHIY